MVLNYYKLREQPFGVTPDDRFLYLSATHREALASLLYGIESRRGFIALIAKPGMGKTTLLFHALEQLQKTSKTVFLFQTIRTPVDFLHALLNDLGLATVGCDLIELQAKLNAFLLEQSRVGKRLIVVIDEAQNLDESVFELIRMLSNFETSREKLMQIVLSGQLQMAQKLASPSMEQLRQRVSMVAQLAPFSLEETKCYVQHRLRVAGYTFEVPFFTERALALIAMHSEGIPRNINNLCFNALSLGCALGRKTIDTDVLREVLGDLDLRPLRDQSSASPPAALGRTPATPRQFVSPFVSLFLSRLRSSLASFEGWSRSSLSRFEAVRLRSLLSGFEARLRSSGLLTFGIAAMVLVTLSWAVGGTHGWEKRSSEVHASGAPRRSAVEPPPTVHSEASPVQVNQPQGNPVQVNSLQVNSVQVARGQTLRRICKSRFGICSPDDIAQIRRLNPWMEDVDDIEAGQIIRLPVRIQVTEHGPSVAGKSSNASPIEAGTP